MRYRRFTLFLCLYVLELSLALIMVAIHKKGARPILAFLTGSSGMVFVAGVLVLLLSVTVVVGVLRIGLPKHAKSLSAAVALILWSVALVLGASEFVIRRFAFDTPAGPVFAGTRLLPQRWNSVVDRNRAILAKASSHGSYLIFDNEIG